MNKEHIPLITVPKRGLRVIPPDETFQKMEAVRRGEKVAPFSGEEKYRLKKLVNCAILEQRYPTKEDGLFFMDEVDLKWREQLLQLANQLTGTIIESWREISSEKDIAVILYGSVAKGLTKKPTHKDPSNIDMAVIGNIEKDERLELFDAIRPERCNVQEQILSLCPSIESEEANPGNAGVSIQDLSKLKNNYYYMTRVYISARGFALYDGSGIWQSIENEAIQFSRSHTTPRGKQL